MYENLVGQATETETPRVEIKTREIAKSCEELHAVIEGLEKRLDRYLLHSPAVTRNEVRPSDPHSEFYGQLASIEEIISGLTCRVSSILRELEI